ncbi:prepilin-type N-terminal cleavage/methylation domain-containing protein [Rhodopirellula sp. JC639]|uniref:prepilin-type N-terminal cleavage/methylation domain-containing protein n=1 Tax=Stieleria mannarensis TaxID=2755585 RepID=UPI0016001F20|nr:prepilin-type N-terminal cleavage/methylation domain-containing protein [Rhodopirellula sp. JC639]
MTRRPHFSNCRGSIRPRCDSFRGYTLIELLLVLALTSSLLGGVIGLMTIARKSDDAAERNLFRRQEIRRFADDLRRDVRAAAEIDLDADELVLGAASSDVVTRYQIESGATVIRRIDKGDAKRSAIDHYEVGNASRVEFELIDGNAAVRCTVSDGEGHGAAIQILAIKRPTP